MARTLWLVMSTLGQRQTSACRLPMSALGQKQTLKHVRPMSALHPKADISQFGLEGKASRTL
jgi:hypothetical protein